jgi:hypothetical protein
MGFLSFVTKLFSGPGSNGAAHDVTLQCIQCRRDFIFEAGEQAFFKEKGFSEPKRCPKCRRQNRGGRRFRRR